MLESNPMGERQPVLFDQEKEAFVRSSARIAGLRRRTEVFTEAPGREFWERLVSGELVGRMDVYQYGYTSPDLCDQFREPNYSRDFTNVIWFYFDGKVHFRVLKVRDEMEVLSYITLTETPSVHIQQAFTTMPYNFNHPEHRFWFGKETLITPDMKEFPETDAREFEMGLP